MTKYIGIGIIIFSFILVVFVVSPITNKFTNCFAVASGEIKQVRVPPQVTQNEFCKNGQQIILSLDSCIQNVKDQNIFAPSLFQLTFFLFDAEGVRSVINKHNQVCPQFPVPQLIN